MDTSSPAATELRLPRLALGTMPFGSKTDEATADKMVGIALDAGVNFFDTANAYGDGASEHVLGRLLRGRRQEVTIATKVGSPRMAEGAPLRPDEIRTWLTRSLLNLQTDYVDVYYFHHPDRSTPIEESLGAAQELVREGLVHHLGVSNYAAWQIVEMHAIQERNGHPPVRVSQPVYNLLARRIEEEYVECARRLRLTTVTYNPLAGGLLTGKYSRTAPPMGTRFADSPQYRERYWNQVQFECIHRLTDLADAAGMSLSQLAFRWLLSQPYVNTILLGASNAEQLVENLTACDRGSLPEDVLHGCDEVRVDLLGISPPYAR